jgi:hypothetical protein
LSIPRSLQTVDGLTCVPMNIRPTSYRALLNLIKIYSSDTHLSFIALARSPKVTRLVDLLQEIDYVPSRNERTVKETPTT